MISQHISSQGYPFLTQAYPLAGVMTAYGHPVCIANNWHEANQIAMALNTAFAPQTPNTIFVPITVTS